MWLCKQIVVRPGGCTVTWTTSDSSVSGAPPGTASAARTYAEGERCDRGALRWDERSAVLGAGESADSPPAQPTHQLDRLVLGELGRLVQPVARTHLSHPDETDGEQLGVDRRQSGVVVDHLRHRCSGLVGHPIDPLADLRVVG